MGRLCVIRVDSWIVCYLDSEEHDPPIDTNQHESTRITRGTRRDSVNAEDMQRVSSEEQNVYSRVVHDCPLRQERNVKRRSTKHIALRWNGQYLGVESYKHCAPLEHSRTSDHAQSFIKTFD